MDEGRLTGTQFNLRQLVCKASQAAASISIIGHDRGTTSVVITTLDVTVSFRTFLSIATDRTTVLRAIKIAMAVGFILIVEFA